VKTTPNPRATKKSRGELLELPGPLAGLAVAVALAEVVLAGRAVDGDGDAIVWFLAERRRQLGVEGRSERKDGEVSLATSKRQEVREKAMARQERCPG
jgi:hypothetical protein